MHALANFCSTVKYFILKDLNTLLEVRFQFNFNSLGQAATFLPWIELL